MKFISIYLMALLMFGFQQNSPTEALLKNPFDLQQFKKVKRGSNSGVFTAGSHHLKPEGKGRYFYFFLFPAPNAFVYSSNGNEKNRVRSGIDFQIVTFKPDGKYKDAYLDPTETLIEVVTTYNDPDLSELAFIGLDSTVVKQKLGSPVARKNGCFIYEHENNALVLNVSDGVVKCLKYVRLKMKLDVNKIPKELIEMKCMNQPAR